MKQSSHPSIAISQGKNVISMKVNLMTTIEKEESGMYCVRCPALGVASQGMSIREAKKNITEAVELFIESCLGRGVLDEVLEKQGFQFMQRPMRKKPRKLRMKINAGAKLFDIPAEIPVAQGPIMALS